MNFTYYFSNSQTRANVAGIALALWFHLFIFGSVIIVFQPPSAQVTREITFLGAILDQFEVEKMPPQEVSSKTHFSSIPLTSGSMSKSRPKVTAINKPALTHELRVLEKSTHKIPAAPQPDTPKEPMIYKNSSNTTTSLELQYQPLKLPR